MRGPVFHMALEYRTQYGAVTHVFMNSMDQLRDFFPVAKIGIWHDETFFQITRGLPMQYPQSNKIYLK